MKKIFKIAAVVAATISLSSCADFIDALMNNYFVDGAAVIIGSATVDPNGVIASGFIFKDKQEGSNDEMQVLMTAEQFKQACTDSLSTDRLTVYGRANGGEKSINAMSSTYVTFMDNDPRKGQYETEPVKYYGKIKIDELGGGRYKVGCKVKFSLKQKESSQVDDFEITVKYNGVPELDN